MGAEGRERRAFDPGIADNIRRAVAEMRSAIFPNTDFFDRGQRRALAFSAHLDVWNRKDVEHEKDYFYRRGNRDRDPLLRG